MTLLLVSLALVLLAAAAAAPLLVAERRAIAALQARIRAAFERDGLTLEGDPLGSFALRGKTGAIDVSLQNNVLVKRPGQAKETRLSAIVKVDAPLPDLVVCRTEDADDVMGLLPSVPRARTGDARFDSKYSTFVSEVPSDSGIGFRSAPGSTALVWAKPQVLSQMLGLEMSSLRARDGRCEVVFEPIRPWDAGAALALGANLARSASSQTLLAPETASKSAPTEPLSGLSMVWVVAGAAMFGSMIGCVPISFLPFLRALTESELCGSGGHIFVSSSSHGSGTSYGLYCSNGTGTSLFLHYLACDLLLVAVVSVVCAVVAARRSGARRRWAETLLLTTGPNR